LKPFQLVEHLVQAVRDGAELIMPGQGCPRAQIAFPCLLHGLQDGAQRLSEKLTDGEVHENRDEHDRGHGESERDPQSVGPCLKQTLQADGDDHGVVPTARHRQGHRDRRAGAIRRPRFCGDRPSGELHHLGAFLR